MQMSTYLIINAPFAYLNLFIIVVFQKTCYTNKMSANVINQLGKNGDIY